MCWAVPGPLWLGCTGGVAPSLQAAPGSMHGPHGPAPALQQPRPLGQLIPSSAPWVRTKVTATCEGIAALFSQEQRPIRDDAGKELRQDAMKENCQRLSLPGAWPRRDAGRDGDRKAASERQEPAVLPLSSAREEEASPCPEMEPHSSAGGTPERDQTPPGAAGRHNADELSHGTAHRTRAQLGRMGTHSYVGSPRGSAGRAVAGGSREGVLPRKERKELSLPEKVRVLAMLDGPRVSQSELARRFGVSQPQICRILKNRERILSAWHQDANPGRKRKRGGPGAASEAALLQWAEGMRAAHPPAPQPEPAEALRKPGWDPAGPQKEAEPPLAAGWASAVLPHLLRSYAAADIYSCTETSILIRALPAGAAPWGRGPGARGRLSLLLCANADGSDKTDVLAVGRHPAPRCFEGVRLAHMPWMYRASQQARLTAPLFVEWLQGFDAAARQQRRHVALLLGPSSAKSAPALSHVRVLPLPPARPLDRGVVRYLKGLYRRRMLTRHEELATLPTISDALHVLAQAWRELPCAVIQSSFRAAGFSLDRALQAPALGTVQALRPVGLERLTPLNSGPDGVGVTEGVLLGRAMAGPVDEEEDEEDDPPAPPCPSKAEAMESLGKLRRYLECHATAPGLLHAFYQLEDAVHAVCPGTLRGEAATVQD
ncbi:tigger transposable element-derived protein 3 isoform X2 [Alligator mississippiensis]|nr:tigger transposable element-derived protein 3 isoform X2 [Alligator mississippiensis]